MSRFSHPPRLARKIHDPVAATDRALIEQALAAGKVTQCPTADLRDPARDIYGAFGVLPGERKAPDEVEALCRRESGE